MPKKTITISKFGGGVMNVGSGRDIKEDQSYEIVNMNPNSEAGSVSLHGSGKNNFRISNDAGSNTDTYGAAIANTNLTLKAGQGLFKINSDYSGLLECDDIEPNSNEAVFNDATENPVEYFFISTNKSADGTVGMYINILQNLLDGANDENADANINVDALTLSTNADAFPSFFYAAGGVRIVNGNDSESDLSPYWLIRRVKTDFGLLKERFKDHDTFPWTEGDSPFIDHWVINEIRAGLENSWEWTDDQQVVEDTRLSQPIESFAHCVETLSTEGYSTSSEMEDGTVMFMINNHIDNEGSASPGIQSVHGQQQLRACKGTDIIKIQMMVTTAPESAAGGAWSLDFEKDEYYITYFYDNGMESRLTKIRAWFGGWTAAGNDSDILLIDDSEQNLNNMRWFPQIFTDNILQKDPNSIPIEQWDLLGGGFQNGKIDGIGMKLQCMIGNETIGNANGSYARYYPSSGNAIWDGSLSENGLIQGKAIKGCRMYLKSQRAFGDDKTYLLCEVDFEKGIRVNGSPKYYPFNTKKTVHDNLHHVDKTLETTYVDGVEHGDDGGRGKWMFCETGESIVPIPVETYKLLNGIDYTKIVVPSFKTSVVLNGRTYIGNVRVRGTSHPDRMMKSSVYKYDTYSDDGWIDLEVQDADEIIHLASIGDKLLQFKRNILHIMNCQEEGEVLENSYKFAGVTNSSQVTTTDFGIIWANTNGLFFYNGSKMQNLLDDEGDLLLDKASWRDVVTSTKNEEVIVGYHANTKDIVIMRQGASGSRQTGGFIYNLYKKNIIKLSERFTAGVKSNFVDTFNGDLAYLDEDSNLIKLWTSDPAEEKLYAGTLLQTRDITFKNPSVRKTVSSIYITYKSKLNSYVNIDANIKKIDGTEELVKHLGGTENYSLADTSDKWTTVRIKTYYDATTSTTKSLRSKFKNITSISLIFKRQFGTVPPEFMVDDISFSYREKSIR